jgi:hypothetical protein
MTCSVAAAKLRLGLNAKPKTHKRGPQMAWEAFRDEYSRLKVATFRSHEAKDAAEIRLDVCERIANPRRLADMARAIASKYGLMIRC